MDGIRNWLRAVVLALLALLKEELALKPEALVLLDKFPVTEAVHERANQQHGVVCRAPLARPVERGPDIVHRNLPLVHLVDVERVEVLVKDLEFLHAREDGLCVDVLDVAERNQDRFALLRDGVDSKCGAFVLEMIVVLIDGRLAVVDDLVARLYDELAVLVLESRLLDLCARHVSFDSPGTRKWRDIP